MTVATHQPRALRLSPRRGLWRGRTAQVGAVVAAMVVAHLVSSSALAWPDALKWNALSPSLDRFQVWLLDHRSAPDKGIVFRLFNGLATFLDNLVGWLNTFFLDLTWVGTAAFGVLIVLRFGGVRAALLVLGAFASFAATGLWEQSVQTLALMLAAVVLSLAVGMPLGVLAGRSSRFRRTITPVLDAMQIVPAFAYLMPVVILFSVGPGAAVVTTMIYAIPPAVRITALGVRGVPANTVEAAEAMGATRPQVLGKVQLPLARRMLLLSVNQTILFALSMVVIAGLIGGQGLGDAVTSGLYSNPALALLAGFTIVIMAIALDRATQAIAERTDPARRHVTAEVRRRLRLATLATGVAIAAIAIVARLLGAGGIYERSTAQEWLLARIQSVLDYVQNPSTIVFHVTEPTGNFIVQHGLEPLRNFFVDTPWPVTLAGLTAIAFVLSGLRPAVTTLLMLAAIGVMGEWAPAMETASQVLVATALTVVVGVALGVWAAESALVTKILRPILDVLQTLPQLVYLTPFIYQMPVAIVPGVLASMLYAAPVVIRLVAAGVREVDPPAVEAAGAFGATRLQLLLKVKIPLARDAIMLGVNQGVIMVLAVVVIGGLVGSGALGYEVAQGLQRNQFGQGVVASLAILALGIALDRVTQGKSAAARAGQPLARMRRRPGSTRRFE
jgi:glycine betaine/proline transport system permease protein